MAYAGLRPNEAFALRRRHLDDFGQLVVAEGLVEVRGHLVETDGKTHTARVVPLPASVLAALEAHLAARLANHPDALMFTTPTGRPIALRNVRRTLECMAQRVNAAAVVAALFGLHGAPVPPSSLVTLPGWLTPYTLRHTCASLMAQRGVPVTTAAAIMGHDPAVYLRTYAHLYPGDLRTAAAALEGARREADHEAPATPMRDGAGGRSRGAHVVQPVAEREAAGA